MKYKLLGKSGLRVSEIALGTMTTGNVWGWGADKQPSLDVLKTYTEAGGNFIDTAVNYQDGDSEKIIGEFIKGDRDRYVIATKYTLRENNVQGDPNYGGNHRKNLIRSLNSSLKRLKSKYIDVLYLHMWDETVDLTHMMKILNDVVSSGKVNYISISDTPAWIISRLQTIAESHGWYQFQSCQFPYSLSDRSAEREIMPMCKELDIAMTPWGVLEAGLFTGKYSRSSKQGESTESNLSGRLTEGKWGNPSEKSLKMAIEVDNIADELGVPSSNVAIRWVMDRPGVVIPVIGATKGHQLEENLKAVEINLTEDQTKRLDEIADFKRGFAYDFIHSSNVKNLVHGDTFESLINHRVS